MSNYPPTPSFWSTFKPSSQSVNLLPSSQMYNGQHSSMPGGGRSPPAPHTSMTTTAQTRNAFDQNSKLSSFNTQPALPKPMPYLTQFHSSALPPPPFPPVPIPPNGFLPQTFQQPHETPVNTDGRPQFRPLTPKPSHGNLGKTPNSVEASLRRDREEGELSDGEMLGKHMFAFAGHGDRAERLPRGSSQIASATSQPPGEHRNKIQSHGATSRLQEKIQPLSQSENSSRKYENNLSNYEPPLELISGREGEAVEHGTLIRRGSSSSYHPASPSSPQKFSDFSTRVPSRYGSPTTSSNKTTSNDISKTQDKLTPTVRRYSPTVGKSAAEIRDLAKNAILNLLPYQFRFQELLAEGIDEDILKNLYEELRLKMYPQTSAMGPSHSPSSQPLLGAAAKGPDDMLPSGLADSMNRENERPSTNLVPPQAEAPSPVRSSRPATSMPDEEANHVPALAKPKTIEAQPTNAPAVKRNTFKSIVTGPHSSASIRSRANGGQMERKDLIAQKIAAKSGKSLAQAARAPTSSTNAVVSDVTGPTAPARDLTAEVLQDSETAKDDQPAKQRNHQQSGTAYGDKANPPAEPAGPQERVHDPNELLRQKLAALKSDNSATDSNAVTELKGAASFQPFPPEEPLPITPPPQSSDKTTPLPSAPIGNDVLISTLDNAPAFPSIPGLFMTSSIGKPQPTSSVSPIANTSQQTVPNHRKRPVAADFDSEPKLQASFKRPFGKGKPDQPLVIDVSDDETADEAEESDMEIDVHHQEARTDGVSKTQNGKSLASNRDTLSLPNFPNSRQTVKHAGDITPNPTLSTPPIFAAASKNKVATQEDLKRKEDAIQLMQKKIKELEQRKAKQSGSGAQTPVSAMRHGNTINPSSPGSAVMKPATSAEIDRLIEDTTKKVEEDKLELAEAQAAEVSDSGETQRAREQRERQRVEIQTDLQRSEEELELERKRLNELRLAKERVEISIQEAVERKSRLVKQLETLETERSDAFGGDRQDNSHPTTEVDPLANFRSNVSPAVMPTQQEDTSDKQDARKVLSDPVGQSPNENSTSLDSENVLESSVVNNSLNSHPSNSPIDELLDSSNESMDISRELGGETNTTTDMTESHTMANFQVSINESGSCESKEQPPVARVSSQTYSPTWEDHATMGGVEHQDRTSSAPESAKQSDSGQEVTSATSDDLYPPAHPPQSTVSPTRVESPREHTEIEMGDTNIAAHPSQAAELSSTSEASQEDTSAEFRHAEAGLNRRENDEHQSHVEQPDDDSDSYEPPDVTSSAVVEQSAVETPPFSPAPIVQSPPLGPSQMAASISSHLERLTPEEDSIRQTNAIADSDGATLEANNANTSEVKSDSQALVPISFKPYESPLKLFKSYRYHRNYLEDVAGGFRSLTFSNNADPFKPICPFEMGGGVCNDTTCGNQHFRTMGLSDDMVLVQIGSVNEGRNEEEKARYMSGLKQILQELRSQKVKDFSTVASEIAAYRLKFLHDDSRVLILDPQDQT
ncbi:MAG: hypothetical protein M1837_005075 [Sclerophora amabilis]|nr:MAG: hypothetical protein M1837_005075 [Sclerophora amabilis]